MDYQIYKPSGIIKDYVKFFWSLEMDANHFNPYFHSTTASVYPRLAFVYKGNFRIKVSDDTSKRLFSCGFQAQTRKYSELISEENTSVLGLYFYPYALPMLFGIPAEEFSNNTVSLTDALGKTGEELEDRMLNAKDNSERMLIITSFLEACLIKSFKTQPEITSSILKMIRRKGIVDLNEVVDESCLSQRHFERKFKLLSGFSPKVFCRILRFEHSIDLLIEQKKSLIDAAYLSGFYDQSHFIRDFKEFSGLSPTIYLTQDLSIFER